MSTKKIPLNEKLKKTIDCLYDYSYIGYMSFKVLSNFRDVRNNTKTQKQNLLFTTLELSSACHGIIVLTNLYKPNKDSITLQFAYNLLIELNDKSENKASLGKIKKCFETLLSYRENNEDLFMDINTMRDKHYSHLDKAFINNPNKMGISTEAFFDKIESLYTLTIKNLTTIYQTSNNSSFIPLEKIQEYSDINFDNQVREVLEVINS